MKDHLNPNHWYLVQRLERQDFPEGKRGVDAIVSHDYMGSAEFEFGAVPRTWKALRKKAVLGELVLHSFRVPFSEEKLWVISERMYDKGALLQGILRTSHLSPQQFHLKERSHFPNESKFDDTKAWLVLIDPDRPDNVFALWSFDKQLTERLYKEIQLPLEAGNKADVSAVTTEPVTKCPYPPVNENELRLFDPVLVQQKGGYHVGIVVGIHPKVAVVKNPDGTKGSHPYRNLFLPTA